MSHLSTSKAHSPHPQTASRFFNSLVEEIRRAVYVHLINTAGVHIVRNEQGNFRFRACVGPDLYAGHIGSERCSTTVRDITNPLFGRRLGSSWGPHWECEEIALKSAEERNSDGESQAQAAFRDNCAILRVCKRMHFEVVELMTGLVCFNVTDLPTLDALFKAPGASSSSSSCPVIFGIKNSLIPQIKKLDITLRLPLPFFKALDGSHVTEGGSSTPVLENENDLDIWSRLHVSITQLNKLRCLRIWLDHTNNLYWSHVNERAALSQFEPLARNPNLDLVFDLPNLHPQLEDPQRHYVGDENVSYSCFASVAPLKIRRIQRQRYQSEITHIGSYLIRYHLDFPHCLDHYLVESKRMSQAQLVEWERSMWRGGINVDQFLSSNFGFDE